MVRWATVVLGAAILTVAAGGNTALARCQVPEIALTINHKVTGPIRKYKMNSRRMEVLDPANAILSKAAGLARGHTTKVGKWDKKRCPKALNVKVTLASEILIANELRNKKCYGLANSHMRAHADQYGKAAEAERDYLAAAIVKAIKPLADKSRRYTKVKTRQADWAAPIIGAVDAHFPAIEKEFKKLAAEYHKTVVGQWKNCRNIYQP